MISNNRRMKKINFVFISLVLFVTLFSLKIDVASAQENFEISGWIPYWKVEKGIESITPNLNSFSEVNPFVFTVKESGELYENSPLSEIQWVTLRQQSESQNIRFIPTVTWGGSDAIHNILSDPEKRQNHIRSIMWHVYKYKLDGIDIDYEAKYAKTRQHFSLFLKELQEAMGYDKWIMCTIEARTPLDSRYSSPESIPDDIEYSNDFVEINKYCDRVRIMSYDQGRIDLKLNETNDHPYIPVADPLWVKKTIEVALKDIDKDKIVIGVPTYGYEYDMFSSSNGIAKALESLKIGNEKNDNVKYSRLWSFNPGYAMEQADKLNLTPTRNSAGELSLVYPAKDSIDPSIPLPFATRVMSWPDSVSVKQKAELAKELGVRGIALFRIDGGQDPLIWDVLKEYDASRELKKIVSLIEKTEDDSLVVPSIDLEINDKGEDVRNLQKLLNAKGFLISEQGPGSPGNETTIFGDATKAALIRFQKANNISPASGYFGPLTRSILSL